MQRINYQILLEKIIDTHTSNAEVPYLLLHSCCAPCSSYTLEYLSQYFRITVLYFNPNITPEEEYIHRETEEQRFINELTTKYPVEFLAGRYNPDEFFSTVKGFENEPEGGERCFKCYRLRLEETAKVAKSQNFDYFTTTLSISPLKNADKINEIGNDLAQKYQIKFLPSDFKKKGGYLRSIELSKIYKLYRQNYCGCIFSKRDNTIVERDYQKKAITE